MSADGVTTKADGRIEARGLLLQRPRPEVAQRLVDATIEVIDARGETAVRVQEIVATVGTQIPVLYRHFGNREGLVQAAQADRLQDAIATDLAFVSTRFAEVGSADEFRTVLDEVLAFASDPARGDVRARRVNMLGSTYARPALAATVNEIMVRSLDGIAEVFAGPQRQGWIRADLDVRAFAAWFAGQMIGRSLIELGETGIDGAAWNEVSADAVRHILFG